LKNNDDLSVAEELRDIKMLLVLQSLTLGCQQKHVAAALGVSDATLSRMFPKGFVRDLAKVAKRRAPPEA
jgi:hypothetical protein